MHIKGEVKIGQVLRVLYLTQVHLEQQGHLLDGQSFTKVTGSIRITQSDDRFLLKGDVWAWRPSSRQSQTLPMTGRDPPYLPKLALAKLLLEAEP